MKKMTPRNEEDLIFKLQQAANTTKDLLNFYE